MNVKLKVTSVIKLIIFALILINLSLTKLFSDILNKPLFSQVLIVLSIYIFFL